MEDKLSSGVKRWLKESDERILNDIKTPTETLKNKYQEAGK